MAANEQDTRLVLQISADIKSLENSMKRAGVIANDNAKAIESSYTKAGASVDRSMRDISGSMQRSSKAMAADATNLRFQFNDLFSQISSGTSVAQAFGQQAGQMSQVLGGAGGVRGAASLAGQALLGMLNPLYAIPIALSLALPALINYFSEAEKGGAASAEEIAKQASAVRKLAESWKSDATPGLMVYLNELIKVTEQTEKIARTSETLDKVFEPAKAAAADVGGEIENIISLLQSTGDSALAQTAIEIGRAFDAVKAKTEANQPALKEIERLQQLIRQAQESQIPAVVRLAQTIQATLLPVLQQAANISKEVRISSDFSNPITGPSMAPGNIDMRGANASIAAQNREAARKQGEENARAYMDGLEPAFRSRLTRFIAVAQQEAGKITVNSGLRSTERQAQLFAEAVKKYGSEAEARRWVAPPGRSMHESGGAADLGYESEAVKKWAHAHAESFGLVFRLKNEDWHVEQLRTDATRQATAAQTQKTAATQAAIAPTQALSAAEQERADRLAGQIQAQEDFARSISQMAGSAVSTFVNDLRQGASAGDAFKSMLNGIIDQLIQMTIQMAIVQPLFAAFGGGSGMRGIGYFPPAPVMHSGSKTGGVRAMRSGVSPALFAGAPRLHDGLMPGEFPAILQRGEVVIPKTATRKGGSMVDNSVINLGDIAVDVQTGLVTASNDDARQLGRQIDTAVQAVLVRESRPGGLLRRA